MAPNYVYHNNRQVIDNDQVTASEIKYIQSIGHLLNLRLLQVKSNIYNVLDTY